MKLKYTIHIFYCKKKLKLCQNQVLQQSQKLKPETGKSCALLENQNKKYAEVKYQYEFFFPLLQFVALAFKITIIKTNLLKQNKNHTTMSDVYTV